MSVIHLQSRYGRPGAARRRAALDALSDATQAVFATLDTWLRRRRERDQLGSLSERMLKDIGLTHAERDFLVNKPFWRE